MDPDNLKNKKNKNSVRKHLLEVAKPSKYSFEEIWIKLMFKRNNKGLYPIYVKDYEHGNEDENGGNA